MVEKTGTTFLANMRYYSNRIDTRLCDNNFPDNTDFALGVARCMLRHNCNHQDMREHFKEVQDIKFLIEDMKSPLRALQEDVQFLVSAASVKHAKQVTWFTKFATLLVPINTVAAILAVIGSDGVGNTRFKIFGGVTVPLLLISSPFIFYWRAAHVHSLELDLPPQDAIVPALNKLRYLLPFERPNESFD